MGYVNANAIQKGVDFLLKLLAQVERVIYSDFYDGSEERSEQLLRGLGLDDDHYVPEMLLDLAAFQLEEEGLVKREELDELLVDGEQDYLIELTKRGREFLDKNEIFECRGEYL